MKIFKPLLDVANREISRMLGKWPYLFIILIGPLLAFIVILRTFSANVPSGLPIAVVDEDHTSVSRLITRMVDATSIAKIIKVSPDLGSARHDMEKGKIEAILYIPSNTEKEIIRGRTAELALYVNNANVLKGGLLSSSISKTITTISAGMESQVRMKRGAASAEALQQTMPVMLHTEVLFNPYISYSYFLTSSLLPVMLIVFTLLGSVYTLGNELKNGTATEWLQLADNNILLALMGKMIPYTVAFGAMAMLMNLILFSYLGVPMRGHFQMIILGELLMILSYQFLAVFLVGLTSNLRLSLSLASAYTMMALTFSGLTFPIFAMPAVARTLAHLFPFTYWLKIFISQALRGEPAINALSPMYAFWLFIFLGALFIPRLNFIMKNEKYWGRF